MKHSRIVILTLSTLTFFLYFSGVIRDDIKEEEYLKLAQQKQFDCVVQIIKDTLGCGSGVLISERFVLSAAHIFVDFDIRLDTLNFNGQTVVTHSQINKRKTSSNLFVIVNNQKVKVKNCTIHSNYLNSGTCDISLLELEHSLSGVSPANLNTELDELNSNVVGVGYGASGPANRRDLIGFYNKKIAGENVVDSLGGAIYLGNKTIMMCDFDHPTKMNCNKMGSNIPRPLEYISSGGDSGGGLFRQKGEKWELIGICSFSSINTSQLMKTGYYGQTMNWTRAAIFTDWIIKKTE